MATGGTRAHDEMDGATVGAAQRRIRVEWARNVARGRTEGTTPNTTLYVADYDPHTTPEELRATFEQFGKVVRVSPCKKFTFIEFEKMEDAEKAHQGMQNKTQGARTLTVQYARPEPHRSVAPPPSTVVPASTTATTAIAQIPATTVVPDINTTAIATTNV